MQDWSALARYDSELRELLQYHKPFLRDPQLAPQIAKAKAAHQAALAALKAATAELESDMVQVSAQQERALAYQLAMTMEG
ncbi:LafD [Vibrio furnissii CIP 102972]|nr:LafD [Vibrio furnissii CIP 102972]